MDAFERKAFKQSENSRLKWKAKALDRQQKIRQLETTVRDLRKSRDHWKEKYRDSPNQQDNQMESIVPSDNNALFF